MRGVNSQVAEIVAFLNDFRSCEPDKKAVLPELRESYKKFHAILIWQNVVNGSRDRSDEVKLYLNEVSADLAQSLLSALMGFYKPSRMMLRSAIENLMRVATLLEGMKALECKTVYELSNLFKETELLNNKITDSSVQQLLNLYAQLCGYVHTATPMEMDQRIPFSKIVEAKPETAVSCLKEIYSVSLEAGKILFFLDQEMVARMHHRDADYIRDQLSPSFKRSLKPI